MASEEDNGMDRNDSNEMEMSYGDMGMETEMAYAVEMEEPSDSLYKEVSPMDGDIAPAHRNDGDIVALNQVSYMDVYDGDIDSGLHVTGNGRHRDITWSNVCYAVGEKDILNSCWGQVPHGNVCAILGPSGAGKSSLLNVLAGRVTSNHTYHISGTVKISGEPIVPSEFRKNIAYVMQDDALMATATPREALLFSASMRLPQSDSMEKLILLTDKLLADLGLTECADVIIGNALIKGISGGQRKRTSVGVEVITDPLLLFLDEPTSGLDSHTASNLVILLKKIAMKDCVVLCTIHQPSSEVFSLFDSCIVMRQGEQTCIVLEYSTAHLYIQYVRLRHTLYALP